MNTVGQGIYPYSNSSCKGREHVTEKVLPGSVLFSNNNSIEERKKVTTSSGLKSSVIEPGEVLTFGLEVDKLS